MFLFEFARRRAGYKLPRPTTWIIHGLNYFFACKVETELFPGVEIELDLTDNFQRYIFWQGVTFERPTPAILRNWCIEKADTFFDIGANFGFYSYYILAYCPKISVYSFEPNPSLYAKQIGTKTRNQMARYYPANLGLSDRADALKLHVSPLDSGVSTFGPHPELENQGDQIEVNVTSFDEWIQKMNLPLPQAPSWVAKIDVEGYEVKVLNGMRQSLQAHAFKGICIEVNHWTLAFCGETGQAIYDFMDSCGYKAYDEQMQLTGAQTDEFRNVFFRPE